MPYHRYGTDKYKNLGRDYTLENLVPPSDSKMEELKKAAEQKGLKCQIGG